VRWSVVSVDRDLSALEWYQLLLLTWELFMYINHLPLLTVIRIKKFISDVERLPVFKCPNLYFVIYFWEITLVKSYYGLVYPCCSHLEHRPSVKRFVSLQFINLRHSVGLLERVISPSQGRYLTQTQNKHRQTSMPRVGFEPADPSVWASEDSSYHISPGHCDRKIVL
jgi:hypothetical protein